MSKKESSSPVVLTVGHSTHVRDGAITYPAPLLAEPGLAAT